MRQVFRAARISHIDNRSSIRLHPAGQGIERSAAMMADVGDKAVGLAVNHRPVGRTILQIVEAHQRHVSGFGDAARARRQSRRAGGKSERKDQNGKRSHDSPPFDSPTVNPKRPQNSESANEKSTLKYFVHKFISSRASHP